MLFLRYLANLYNCDLDKGGEPQTAGPMRNAPIRDRRIFLVLRWQDNPLLPVTNRRRSRSKTPRLPDDAAAGLVGREGQRDSRPLLQEEVA